MLARYALGRLGNLRDHGAFGYGLIAQILSSATSFGLVVLAGHVLGPAGVGTLFVGLGAYLAVLGLARALLSDPLVATSAALREDERARTGRFAMTLAVSGALPIAGLLAMIGLVLPARLGDGMLFFAPWLPFAIAQDMARVMLFRDLRGRTAVLLDAIWFLAMVLLAPVAFAVGSLWAVSVCWGAGAFASALVGIRKVSWRPSRLAPAFAWWRTDGSRLGRWLGLRSLLYSVVSYTSVLSVAGILGAREYGGFRAVQSLFTPLTVLGPAVSLPGLPLISRTLAESPRRALAVSWRLGGVVTAVTAAYVVIFSVAPGLLGVFFGQEFSGFGSIIVPIGIAQIVAAPAIGLGLLLKAQQRGRALLLLGLLNLVVSLVTTVTAAMLWGLEGAAWAGVVSSAVVGAAFAASALAGNRREPVLGATVRA